MAQEYVIKDVKPRTTVRNGYGEYQVYSLALEGVGEPVKLEKIMPVHTEPTVGDTIYGRLVEEQGNGRSYYCFKPEPRQNSDPRETDIHAQVALKLAIEVWLGQGANPDAYNNIAAEAVHFGKLINVIKKELEL